MRIYGFLLGIFTILFPVSLMANQISWVRDYNRGVRQATSQSKLIMVDFYAPWWGACKKLDAGAYRNSDLIKLSREFVCIKLDGDKGKNKSVMRKFNIRSYPTILLLSSNGNDRLDQMIGAAPASLFIRKMKAAMQKTGVTSEAREAKQLFEKAQNAEAKGDIKTLISLLKQIREKKSLDRSLKEKIAILDKTVQEFRKEAASYLEQAKKHTSAREYENAMTLLKKVTTKYKGTPEANDARKILKDLKSDPEVAKIIEEQEKRGQVEKLWATAERAEKKEKVLVDGKSVPNYLKAGDNYFKIMKKFPNTYEAKQAKKRLSHFKKDSKITQIVREQRAAKRGKKGYDLAKNYVANGRPDLAVKELNKIIKKYKGTSWAKKAKKLKKEIGK